MSEIIIKGAYTDAKVFTVNDESRAVEQYALAQIRMLCDNPASEGSKMRVMPDVHPGKVGTIGLTMTVGNKILPEVVGIDIGCGITIAEFKGFKKEFQAIDRVTAERIPSGAAVRKDPHPLAEEFDYGRLFCHKCINLPYIKRSMGSLGSGNHFIEIDRSEDGTCYLMIHSGSRHLGKEVTEYYLKEGQKKLKEQGIIVPYELTYLEGDLMEQYLHDVEIVQGYAAQSREVMLKELCTGMKWKIIDSFSSVHNYVERLADGVHIIRKGAISAQTGEKVIIPINMRDGGIIGVGKGNPDWNYSAPHGSGRLMKREDVKNRHTVSQFKAEMKGIYSSCIGKDTLDESPFAYRSMEDIREAIVDTVEIREIIRPIYNYKAGGKE